MAIFITGDIHARINIDKLLFTHFDPNGLNRGDYLIILGDFGLVWDDSPFLEKTLDWLEEKPWTTLFIDGNHENFDKLSSYEIEKWNGGKIQKIREHVIHLMRGEVYEIDNKSFFCLGGARSVDKDYRIVGKSWWEEEIPSEEEKLHALDNLAKRNWEVDYILTHECPSNIRDEIGVSINIDFKYDGFSVWLMENIEQKTKFKHWFFGHHHQDIRCLGDFKFTCLFNNIYDLEEDYWSSRIKAPIDTEQFKAIRGLTISQIAELVGVNVKDVERAMCYGLNGSSLGINDNGECIVWSIDITRVLDWL